RGADAVAPPLKADRPIVQLRPPAVSVDPATTTEVEVSVHNAGPIVEEYAIDLLGPAAAGGAGQPSTVPLFPGQEGGATVRLSPPRGPAAPAGPHDLGIRVRSTRD